MSRYRALLFGGGAAAALVLASTLPAAAATTPTTLTIGAGALTISAPTGTANLGTVASGVGTLSGNLGGNVVVTDNRGLALGGWAASASITDFSDGATPTPHTIPATDVLYTPGTITPTGVVVAVGLPVTLSNTPISVVTATGVLGSNSAAWDPTLTVTIPAAAPAGTYSATLTHSVA